MPSFKHGAIVRLLRSDPRLIPDLLERSLGVTVPPHAHVTITDATLEQLAPTEVHADLVLELGDPDTPPVLSLITEVQLRIDPEKLFTWPAYQTTQRLRRRCDVGVVVVTPFKSVAAWARRPIPLGLGNFLHVHVLGPEQLPPILDPAFATANPTLAILTTMAHGNEPGGLDVLMATLLAVPRVDRENLQVYAHLIEKALSAALRQALHEQLAAMQKPYDREIPWTFRPVFDHGFDVGRAKSLLKLLEVRGLPVTPEQRERILHTRDEAQFDAWTERAAFASTTDEVFA